MRNERYLGDSVYVKFDGWGVCLYTNNGYGPENKIILEPSTCKNLIEFIGDCGKMAFDCNGKCLQEGDFVIYKPKNQLGRVKEIRNMHQVFVVYHCSDDWDNWHEYTGASTEPKELECRDK